LYARAHPGAGSIPRGSPTASARGPAGCHPSPLPAALAPVPAGRRRASPSSQRWREQKIPARLGHPVSFYLFKAGCGSGCTGARGAAPVPRLLPPKPGRAAAAGRELSPSRTPFPVLHPLSHFCIGKRRKKKTNKEKIQSNEASRFPPRRLIPTEGTWLICLLRAHGRGSRSPAPQQRSVTAVLVLDKTRRTFFPVSEWALGRSLDFWLIFCVSGDSKIKERV